MNAIDELHLDFPFMGSRQLTRALGRRGLTVGRLHVRTLMRKMGISAIAPQPGTSQRNPRHKTFPYLLRKLTINRSNQVWALDTTYIRMKKGFVYLSAVVDVFSRRILAHRTAITLEAIHAVEALQEAFNRFGTPEIVKTDQGSQFTAQEFVDLVLSTGARLSMDGRGAWRDNVFEPPRVSRRVFRSSKNRCQALLSDLLPVVCLSLCRRYTPYCCKQSCVIKPVYPLQGCDFNGFSALPRPTAMNQLGLVQSVDCFSQSVVIRVPFAANRWFDAGLLQALGVFNAYILRAPVRMMDQSVTSGLSFIKGLF
jgi:putative transposase